MDDYRKHTCPTCHSFIGVTRGDGEYPDAEDECCRRHVLDLMFDDRMRWFGSGQPARLTPRQQHGYDRVACSA